MVLGLQNRVAMYKIFPSLNVLVILDLEKNSLRQLLGNWLNPQVAA